MQECTIQQLKSINLEEDVLNNLDYLSLFNKYKYILLKDGLYKVNSKEDAISNEIRNVINDSEAKLFRIECKERAIAYILIKKMTWDTKILGLNVGRLIILPLVNNLLPYSHALGRVFKELQRMKYQLLISRIPYLYINVVQTLERLGAITTDVLVTLKRNILVNPPNPDEKYVSSIEVKTIKSKEDLYHIMEIALDAFLFSHYFTDPLMCAWAGKKVYEQWILNAPKYGKSIYVALKKDLIIGFIVCTIKSADDVMKYGVIELIAVRDKFRGKGVGTILINKCLNFLSKENVSMVFVGTQASNISALNFYIKRSFMPAFIEHTLHMWCSSS